MAERIAQLADYKDLEALLDRERSSARDEPDPGLVYGLDLLDQKHQFLFRDTLIKLILSPNLEYKELTAKIRHAV